MAETLLFNIAYFVCCVILFVAIQRPIFIMYNRRVCPRRIDKNDWKSIYKRGIPTDFIAASYITAVPTILVWVNALVKGCWIIATLTAYNVIIAVLMSLLIVADTALYKFWEYKIEVSVLSYLRSFRGAFASVTTNYLCLAIGSVLLMSVVLFCLLQTPIFYLADRNIEAVGLWWHAATGLLFLLCVAALFFTIRGIHSRPYNPSMAFFSNIPFFNHSALNPLYNFIYSAFNYENFSKQFRYFDCKTCEEEFARLFPNAGVPTTELLNNDRPNILLIVWESLCARFVSTLGGVEATPNVDRLAKEGVLFTHCDAGSFRTDRGIVCILSGYLGQPTTSIIKNTHKLPHLPALPRRLKELGYSTTVIHGGMLPVMHKSDYYLAVGHDTMLEQKDFPASAPKCKWGIHDHYMFDRVFDDIMQKTQQGKKWLTTFQTLSSHEPFVVPFKREGLSEAANAFAYTDDAFGRFIDKLKKTEAWKNLLVVCVGDHGLNLAGDVPRDKYPHIPLLMVGGAVKQPRIIDTLISQTDLAATLLGQMGLPHEEFIFSRDVLADTYCYPFGFHTYNNGFLLRDETGFTNYDNNADRAIEGANAKREHNGKVILQKLYKDLSQR